MFISCSFDLGIEDCPVAYVIHCSHTGMQAPTYAFTVPKVKFPSGTLTLKFSV